MTLPNYGKNTYVTSIFLAVISYNNPNVLNEVFPLLLATMWSWIWMPSMSPTSLRSLVMLMSACGYQAKFGVTACTSA